jgi:hypothetical protein
MASPEGNGKGKSKSPRQGLPEPVGEVLMTTLSGLKNENLGGYPQVVCFLILFFSFFFFF